MSFGNHIIHLNDTKEMPLLGLGTYNMTDRESIKTKNFRSIFLRLPLN